MEPVLIAKAIYGEEEKRAVNEVLDSGWLGNGKKTEEFQNLISKYVGVKHGIFVNSGSSALLLALKSLNLPKGSEVITCAAGFPSTLNPIIHLGLVPVVVDCELETFNINPKLAVKAMSKKTSAIVFAHAAGNPVDIDGLRPIFDRVPSIEDACDALGATYGGQQIGSFGTLAAFSFYASHHITAAGGGGMVVTNDTSLATKIYSLRDWGKYYDNPSFYQTNFTQFNMDVDGIPYDRNYSYQNVGFNLKQIELGAAFGVAQFDRLAGFVEARNKNFKYYDTLLKHLFEKIKINKKAVPSWFFYPMTLKIAGQRDKLVEYLEKRGIHTRLFFAGNITRQPALKDERVKIKGSLNNADRLMKDTLMIGVHPALSKDDTTRVASTILEFFK
jgi:CDP-4-dehydro-6-deoxyglucose reductase, E1